MSANGENLGNPWFAVLPPECIRADVTNSGKIRTIHPVGKKKEYINACIAKLNSKINNL